MQAAAYKKPYSPEVKATLAKMTGFSLVGLVVTLVIGSLVAWVLVITSALIMVIGRMLRPQVM